MTGGRPAATDTDDEAIQRPDRPQSPVRGRQPMAANFWLSSHYQQWILDREEILFGRQEDLKMLSEDDYKKLFIFFAHVIQTIGEYLKMRQQVIATATVYFRRFYARNSLKSIDPLLLAPTCILLASKVEESGVVHSSKIVNVCSHVIKMKFAFAYPLLQEYPFKSALVSECEFYLLEALDCSLILYHPYRSLLQIIQEFQDETLLTTAWNVVNDSLRTDVALLYPPYLIALAALHLASVIHQKDLKLWFAELSVDLTKIMEISKEILSLYDLWKTFDMKKDSVTLLERMPKPKTASSSSNLQEMTINQELRLLQQVSQGVKNSAQVL